MLVSIAVVGQTGEWVRLSSLLTYVLSIDGGAYEEAGSIFSGFI